MGWQRFAAWYLRGHKKYVISQWITPLEDMNISLFEIRLIRSLMTLLPLHSTWKVNPSGCRCTRFPGTSGLYYFPSHCPCNKTVQQYSIVEYRTTGTFSAHREGFPLTLWSMGPKAREKLWQHVETEDFVLFAMAATVCCGHMFTNIPVTHSSDLCRSNFTSDSLPFPRAPSVCVRCINTFSILQ